MGKFLREREQEVFVLEKYASVFDIKCVKDAPILML
jgi:hypothetical protein